ncbi:hypothetical protein JYU34_008324, partial [Plutella xylostella]
VCLARQSCVCVRRCQRRSGLGACSGAGGAAEVSLGGGAGGGRGAEGPGRAGGPGAPARAQPGQRPAGAAGEQMVVRRGASGLRVVAAGAPSHPRRALRLLPAPAAEAPQCAPCAARGRHRLVAS